MPTQLHWISVQEAADILTRNSGHRILPNYVNLRSHIGVEHIEGKIRKKVVDGRTNAYCYEDVINYVVRKNNYPER